jgi:hypothetical protein
MESSIVLTYRQCANSSRKANLLAVLQWLATYPAIDVVVVEQDAYPTLTHELPHPRCRVVFAYNPGPFNKSWGFNVGVRQTNATVLVFSDADLIVPETLPKAVQLCLKGYGMVKPYRRLYDLTEDESEAVRSGQGEAGNLDLPGRVPGRSAIGEHLVLCGGMFAMRRDAFASLGGWDERFSGWGGEDDAMTYKVQRRRLSTVELDETAALHLWHPRPHADTMGQPHYLRNKEIFASYKRLSDQSYDRLIEVQQQLFGHREKYRPQQ